MGSSPTAALGVNVANSHPRMKLMTMLGRGFLGAGLAAWLGANLPAKDDLRLSDDQPLRLAPVGSFQLRVLSPSLLELTFVTTKPPDPAPVAQWSFVDASGQARLPAAGEFSVSADGHPIQIKRIGFKRRVLYAPFRRRDLRIGNYLYLELSAAIGDNFLVEVKNPSGRLWPPAVEFSVSNDPMRWSPVLHVNQTGYLPDLPKVAMVGYYPRKDHPTPATRKIFCRKASRRMNQARRWRRGTRMR